MQIEQFKNLIGHICNPEYLTSDLPDELKYMWKILSFAHDLDLRRCYDKSDYLATTQDKYSIDLVMGLQANEAMTNTIGAAKKAIRITGKNFYGEGVPVADPARFILCSHHPYICMNLLAAGVGFIPSKSDAAILRGSNPVFQYYMAQREGKYLTDKVEREVFQASMENKPLSEDVLGKLKLEKYNFDGLHMLKVLRLINPTYFSHIYKAFNWNIQASHSAVFSSFKQYLVDAIRRGVHFCAHTSLNYKFCIWDIFNLVVSLTDRDLALSWLPPFLDDVRKLDENFHFNRYFDTSILLGVRIKIAEKLLFFVFGGGEYSFKIEEFISKFDVPKIDKKDLIDFLKALFEGRVFYVNRIKIGNIDQFTHDLTVFIYRKKGFQFKDGALKRIFSLISMSGFDLAMREQLKVEKNQLASLEMHQVEGMVTSSPLVASCVFSKHWRFAPLLTSGLAAIPRCD